jgi:hypothetical protein
MPQEPKTVPVSFHSTGIVTKISADELPMTAYRKLSDVITDIEGTIEVRKGFVPLNAGLPGIPYGFGFLRINQMEDGGVPPTPATSWDGHSWRYAVANAQWYIARAFAPGSGDGGTWGYLPIDAGGDLATATALRPDIRPFLVVYTLDGVDQRTHIFLADGRKFLKHAGGITGVLLEGSQTVALPAARQVGIRRPQRQISNVVVLKEDGSNLLPSSAYYTGTNPTATISASAIGSGILLYQGEDHGGGDADGTTISATASEHGFLNKAPLESVVSGAANLNANDDRTEPIELSFFVPTNSDHNNIDTLVLSFALAADSSGNPDFNSRFQKEIIIKQDLPSQKPDIGLSRETLVQYPYDKRIPVGVWQTVKIKKQDFDPVGISGSATDWSAVYGLRVELLATGPANVRIRHIRLDYGLLSGVDLKWTFTYFDRSLGQESDIPGYEPGDPRALDPNATVIPIFIEVPFPGVDQARVQLMLPKNPVTTPPLANPDHIRIYRQGGTLLDFRLIAEIPYVPGETPSYIDNVSDALAGQALDEDNQTVPYTRDDFDSETGNIIAAPRGVELHDNRLWVWGCPGDPANRLRFSKNIQVESFPTFNIVTVGTASEEIVRALEFASELFVFTRTQAYRIVGNDEQSYRAVDTPIKQGLVSAHGIARGRDSIFMYMYDGIREFPSGKQISIPINTVFHGVEDRTGNLASVNGIPPILARGGEAMGWWDGKLYFSYNTRFQHPNDFLVPDLAGFYYSHNDTTVIYDDSFERWHMYSYGSDVFFTEPTGSPAPHGLEVSSTHLDTLVGSAYPQNLLTPNFMAHALEHGYIDSTEPNYSGILYQIATREFDLSMPDNEKRWLSLEIEANTQGTPMGVEAAFDDEPAVTLGVISTTKREQVILPITGESPGVPGANAIGNSRLSRRIRLCFEGRSSATNFGQTTTGPIRLYKLYLRYLPEPIIQKSFVTAWDNYGVPTPGYFRDLFLECDTFGGSMNVDLQVDQTLAQTVVVNSSGQKMHHIAFNLDIRGTLARLHFHGQDPETRIKVYSQQVSKLPEPIFVGTHQTAYEDMGSKYPKYFKECITEISTEGQDALVTLWLDGSRSQSWIVNTPARQSVTHSLNRDTIGKLARITVTAPDPQPSEIPVFRLYDVKWVVDLETAAADVQRADTLDYLHSWPRYKVLYRLYLTASNPNAPIALQTYGDEILKDTRVIPANPMASGFAKRKIVFPSSLKAKLWRFIFTSSASFQIFADRSELEFRPVNQEDGYTRVLLNPPKTQ